MSAWLTFSIQIGHSILVIIGLKGGLPEWEQMDGQAVKTKEISGFQILLRQFSQLDCSLPI
jgi:hypothetical protein